jgi:hypothetical protein
VWGHVGQERIVLDPTKTVTWGDQTFEEMMIGFYVEVFPKGQMPARPLRANNLGSSSERSIGNRRTEPVTNFLAPPVNSKRVDYEAVCGASEELHNIFVS